MNKVYLDEKGKVFVNGNELKGVSYISVKTDFLGTHIVMEFKGDYKCDFVSKMKTHSLDECVRG